MAQETGQDGNQADPPSSDKINKAVEEKLIKHMDSVISKQALFRKRLEQKFKKAFAKLRIMRQNFGEERLRQKHLPHKFRCCQQSHQNIQSYDIKDSLEFRHSERNLQLMDHARMLISNPY